MKGNMNMVNLALLVVILILVVYCLVTSNKENFNSFYAAERYPFNQSRILTGDERISEDELLNRDTIIQLEDGTTKKVLFGDTKKQFVTDYYGTDKHGNKITQYPIDGADFGTPSINPETGRQVFDNIPDGISDSLQQFNFRKALLKIQRDSSQDPRYLSHEPRDSGEDNEPIYGSPERLPHYSQNNHYKQVDNICTTNNIKLNEIYKLKSYYGCILNDGLDKKNRIMCWDKHMNTKYENVPEITPNQQQKTEIYNKILALEQSEKETKLRMDQETQNATTVMAPTNTVPEGMAPTTPTTLYEMVPTTLSEMTPTKPFGMVPTGMVPPDMASNAFNINNISSITTKQSI
jgi:hypothetical protein